MREILLTLRYLLLYPDWKGRMRACLLWLSYGSTFCVAHLIPLALYLKMPFQYKGVSMLLAIAFWVIAFFRRRQLLRRTILIAKPQLDDALRANHGTTLSEALRGIHNEVVEYDCLFSPHIHEKLAEYTFLDPTETNLSETCIEWARAEGGLIDLHNHPFCNAAFSSADFSWFIYQRVSVGIVATNRMVYVLRVPGECWELDYEDVEDFYDEFLEQLLGDRFLRHPAIKGLTPYEYCTVLACQETAKKFDLLFYSMTYKEALRVYEPVENVSYDAPLAYYLSR